MRTLDFSSWQSLAATLLGLAVVTLLGVGIRLLMMVTFQQRRERLNRQINERLRTLIAAYKTLGGSFTGTLTVDGSHRRDQRSDAGGTEPMAALDLSVAGAARSDRTRRIRDAVEAALSDIILLGTEEQVRLADRAVRELVDGRPVHTHALVVSLRNFIRDALDLAAIPADLDLPMQGPARPAPGGGGKGAARDDAGKAGGGGGTGGGGLGGGGMGGGAGSGTGHDDPLDPHGHHGA